MLNPAFFVINFLTCHTLSYAKLIIPKHVLHLFRVVKVHGCGTGSCCTWIRMFEELTSHRRIRSTFPLVWNMDFLRGRPKVSLSLSKRMPLHVASSSRNAMIQCTTSILIYIHVDGVLSPYGPEI